MKTLLTAKGDLIAGSAANTPIVIPVGGTAGYVLTVNGATDAGMSWAAPGAGTPSGTAVAATAYGIAAAAGTSSEYSRGDHTHGSVADLVSGTAHATLATGVHGAGTANIATTSDITTHAGVKASVHGITIAETLTTVGSFPITFTATEATSVTLPATGTLANTANIATHSAATAGVHGIAAGSAIATTAEIATHAALTGNTHGVANGSTFASSADVVVKLPKQLVENDPLWLDATLSATGKYSGIAQTAVADAACSFGHLVYLKAGSTRWALAGAGTGMSNRLGMVITAATGAADTIAVLTYGNISSTVFPSMAVGGPVYGGVPAGTISGTAAGTAGQYVRVIGHANAAAELHFAPDNTWVELA
jgi:hypothetical protein